MSSTTTITHLDGRSEVSKTPLLDALQRDGFVIIPALLDQHQVSTLRAASEKITKLARGGDWPYIRTVPKQFPPWAKQPPDDDEGGIWGVQHLLHPSAPGRDEFARLYFSDAALSPVKQLMGLQDTEDGDAGLVMELCNLLISPSGQRDFELCWHRDDIRPDVSEKEEADQLEAKAPKGRQLHAQYNIPLYEDGSLVVIPGSHRRVRTPVEREATPFAPELPGQVTVTLQPGDGLFYDSNILHRGIYRGVDTKTETGRMTLHGSVGLSGHGDERARNVLQHGVGDWVEDAHFSLPGRQGRRAEDMQRRLISMGKGREAGFSLVG